MKIPVLSKKQILEVKNGNIIDCFYGIDDESEKDRALKLIINKMSSCSGFFIYYDFRKKTQLSNKKWSYIENVMIYENRNTSDCNRLLSDGTGSYECVLWISANK